MLLRSVGVFNLAVAVVLLSTLYVVEPLGPVAVAWVAGWGILNLAIGVACLFASLWEDE